jgi:hypothetical protein
VTDDGPIATGDGHDFPRLIDERVPGVAAMIDDAHRAGSRPKYVVIRFD